MIDLLDVFLIFIICILVILAIGFRKKLFFSKREKINTSNENESLEDEVKELKRTIEELKIKSDKEEN